MLEVRNVRQWFRTGFWLKPTVILHDISLDVPEGSITGFLGPNGAGKTTLIHLIAGVRRPRAGSVTWKGVNMLEPEARARIGYLPERPYFHDHLTGRQILQYFGRLSNLPDREIAARTPKLLARVGLGHAADRVLRAYSKGMLQRIGIAQALIHEPEFLLLDEPMSGLDPLGRAEMKQIIVDLSREGRTVFFSSHIVPDLESICDRVAIIDRGKMLKSGPLSELLADGSHRSAIRVSAPEGGAAASVPKEAFRAPDGSYVLEVLSDEVNPSLERLMRARASILSVEPKHRSLEEWFLRKPEVSADG